MEIKTNLLGLWFTVLVCTRCCLQKMIKKNNKNISKVDIAK